MACDSNFGNVSLLLALTGANAGTVFVDTSPNAFTVTATGSVATSTASAPSFETSSAYFPNSGQLSVPLTSGGALDLSAGDFTIEGWLNPGVQVPGQGGIFRTSDLEINVFFSSSSNEFTGTFWGSAVSASTNSVSQGVWTAFAFVMHSGILTLYINGNSIGTPSTPTRSAIAAGTFLISNGFYTGYMSDIRVTKGVARYTSNYTPVGPFLGTCAVTVPNVVGEDLATAESNIATAFLTIGTVTTANSPTIPAGSVVSQSPIGGTPAMQGDPINIVESLGPSGSVPAISLTGSLLSDAELAIEENGYVVGSVTCANGFPLGIVVGQSPAAGSSIAPGSTINLTINCGPMRLGTKFVSPMVSKAIMLANPGTINPRVYVPEEDTIARLPLPRLPL